MKDNSCRWLFLIGFLDMFGVSMFIPVILVEAKNMGATPIMTGVIGSIYGCLQLFSSPLIGSWSDSKGKKFVLCFCLLVSGTSYFITGFVKSLPMLIFTRILTGFFKHTHTLGRAYLADVTPPEREGKIFGEFMATSNMGFIIGPVIGGQLADAQDGFFYICSCTTVLYFFSFALLYFKLPEVIPKEKKPVQGIEFKKIFSHLTDIDWHKQYDLMLGRFFFSFAVLIYRSNFSLIMKDNHGFDMKTIGYIISYQGIIGASSGFFVGKMESLYNHKRSKLLAHSTILLTLSFVGLTIAESIPYITISLTLMCFSTSVIRIQYMELSVHRCNKDEKGAVIGVGQSVTSVSRMFSPLVAGISQQVGPHGPGFMSISSSILGYFVTLVLPKMIKF